MKKRVTTKLSAAMLCLSSAMFSLDAVAAPVLSMSSNVPVDVAPVCVTLSVALSNSTPTISYDPLAGTQFDITYPSGQFVVSGVTAGAGAALQRLESNSALQTGRLRVLLSPNGSSTLTEGAIASVNLCHVNGANWIDSTFTLQDAVLGNALGGAVNVMTGTHGVQTLAWGGDTDGDGIADNYPRFYSGARCETD